MKVVGMLHHAVRVEASESGLDAAYRFYTEVLGMEADPNRPDLPGTPGYWMNAGPNQIHLMAVEPPRADATLPELRNSRAHVALAVEDIEAAEQRLQAMNVPFVKNVGRVGLTQIFLQDPSGNMVELQQARR